MLSVPDAVRLPVQTLAAVGLAYASMVWLNLPEIAWAAFSALFVLRTSVEGTVGEAWGRVLGALIGVVLGVGCVLACRLLDLPVVLGAVAGVGVAAYLSMRWQALSYSLVTVTAVTVEPAADVLAGALDKTVAVGVGIACGVLAAVVVLPLSAQHSVRANLANLIETYGELLVKWASMLESGKQRPRLYDDNMMEQARMRAQEMSLQARTFPMDLLYPNAQLRQLHAQIDRLWLTAALIERAGDLQLSEQICSRLGPALDKVAASAQEQIVGMAQVVRRGKRAAVPRRPAAPLIRLDSVIDDCVKKDSFSASEIESIEAIRWAWREVTRELDALADYLDPPTKAKSRPRHQGQGV